jgi:hypothetical protein
MLKTAKSLSLILVIAMGFAFPLLAKEVHANPSRDISVYMIKASDSASAWVGSLDRVRDGVIDAVTDANSNTGIQLSGESISQYTIISSADLYSYALNPPQHAVFINLHGEVVPIPEAYAQNDAESGNDASDVYSGAVSVPPTVSYPLPGFLADPDTNDWYQFYIGHANWYEVTVSMTPSADANFDLELYGPGAPPVYRRGSYAGDGATDSITYPLDMEGTWFIRVFILNPIPENVGDYYFTLTTSSMDDGGAGGGCPFVLCLERKSVCARQ